MPRTCRLADNGSAHRCLRLLRLRSHAASAGPVSQLGAGRAMAPGPGVVDGEEILCQSVEASLNLIYWVRFSGDCDESETRHADCRCGTADACDAGVCASLVCGRIRCR